MAAECGYVSEPASSRVPGGGSDGGSSTPVERDAGGGADDQQDGESLSIHGPSGTHGNEVATAAASRRRSG